MGYVTHEARAGTSLSMDTMMASGMSKEQFSPIWGQEDGIAG